MPKDRPIRISLSWDGVQGCAKARGIMAEGATQAAALSKLLTRLRQHDPTLIGRAFIAEPGPVRGIVPPPRSRVAPGPLPQLPLTGGHMGR